MYCHYFINKSKNTLLQIIQVIESNNKNIF